MGNASTSLTTPELLTNPTVTKRDNRNYSKTASSQKVNLNLVKHSEQASGLRERCWERSGEKNIQNGTTHLKGTCRHGQNPSFFNTWMTFEKKKGGEVNCYHIKTVLREQIQCVDLIWTLIPTNEASKDIQLMVLRVMVTFTGCHDSYVKE